MNVNLNELLAILGGLFGVVTFLLGLIKLVVVLSLKEVKTRLDDQEKEVEQLNNDFNTVLTTIEKDNKESNGEILKKIENIANQNYEFRLSITKEYMTKEECNRVHNDMKKK